LHECSFVYSFFGVYASIDSFVWFLRERIELIAGLSQQLCLTIAWCVCKSIPVCMRHVTIFGFSVMLHYDILYSTLLYCHYIPIPERALKLSATCLKLNPANYTVWSFRRQCLQFLGLTSDKTSVQNDLDLAASIGGSNPKNFQVCTVNAHIALYRATVLSCDVALHQR
jgi:hypothetical protein